MFLPLPDEPAWWAAAPLVAGSRELRALPRDALTRLTEHYLPFTLRVLRRHDSSLRVLVGDSDDIGAQAALWLLEAAREYDADRGVPFAGFLAARLPLFARSLTRSGGSGRFVADSELGYARARERSLREHGREPTVEELVAQFGEDRPRVVERLQAVRVRRALRAPADVSGIDVAALAVSPDGALWAARPGGAGDAATADATLLEADERRAVTEALVLAAWHGDRTPSGRVNATGFFTFLLERYAGFRQRDLARLGRVGTTTIRTAQRAMLAGARQRLAAD